MNLPIKCHSIFGLLIHFVFIGICHADIVTNFDSSLEGWTGGGITHQATGGNPGGYAHFVDPDASGNSIFAPLIFLGDWTVFEGGTLSYDHRIIEAMNVNQFVNYEVEIFGPSDSAIWNSESPPNGVTGWVSIVAPIQESHWNVTGDWSNLLSNVIQLRIRIEHVDDAGTDIEGIDSVRLAAVPEPGLAGLMAIALVGLSYRRNRVA